MEMRIYTMGTQCAISYANFGVSCNDHREFPGAMRSMVYCLEFSV